MDELEKIVRDEITELFEADRQIEAVYKKIRQGIATYEDAHTFSVAVGKILRKAFETMVDGLPDGVDLAEIADSIVVNAITQNYKLTSLICETVQDELNSMAGLGIKAVKPKLDNAKVSSILTQFSEATSPEAAKVALGESVVTYSQTVVDDWVKTNAEFQKNLGLSPMIVRKWSGRHGSHDTKHTDWCEDLDGVWKYGEHPRRVFARHEGCTCSVTYYPLNSVEGRIAALTKGEKDTDKVLWNTGEVFSNSRDAVLRRRRQMYSKEEARRILNEEWKGGRNGLAERHFR